jgi:hypothetical protein
MKLALYIHVRLLQVGMFLILAVTPKTGAGATEPGSADRAVPAVERKGAFVIGISPYLDKSVKDEVYRSIVRLLVEDLPLNSTVSIYDAYELKSITQVNLPNVRAFNSSKTRANQFAPAIRELKLFLAAEHVKPHNTRLNFEAAVRLPQFCDFLVENAPRNGSAIRVLLIGSPLYQDAKEPGFSMVDGYFPSDAHLQVSREESPFGIGANPVTLPALAVSWVYFGDPWLNDLNKEKVTRFWTLYLEKRSGQLVSFTGDLPSAVRSFRQGEADLRAHDKGWTVDTTQTKLEMLRVSRNVELNDWLTRDSLPETSPRPPSVMIGRMKIGIRWKQNIDLDLYSAPRQGAEVLFFQHTRSQEGYYYKDHRSSPGREYEFIEFEVPVDIREVEAFVNFYKGSCPGGPRGEVRIEFDGRIYGASFAIRSDEGNRGRSGASQEEFWTRIPVQEILKISQIPRPAG